MNEGGDHMNNSFLEKGKEIYFSCLDRNFNSILYEEL